MVTHCVTCHAANTHHIAHTAGTGVIFIAKMITKIDCPEERGMIVYNSKTIRIHECVFVRESRHLDNDDNLYCSVGAGCCQFLMLLIKHLMLQLPSTTQTRSMSTNQTIIILGMLQS